jgi:hypothetical protein
LTLQQILRKSVSNFTNNINNLGYPFFNQHLVVIIEQFSYFAEMFSPPPGWHILKMGNFSSQLNPKKMGWALGYRSAKK